MPKRILVCAAHPDDTEIGCGGSLTRYWEEGAKIHSLIFSSVNPLVNPPELLREECANALARLHVEYTLYDFPMRRLAEVRQDILQIMFDKLEEFKPDFVFIPSPHDFHNDHYTVAREGMRAFKCITTLGYELPWNHTTFDAKAFIRLDEFHMKTKDYAMMAYVSQRSKPYFQDNFIYCLARTRGIQSGCHLAESFEVVRWVN